MTFVNLMMFPFPLFLVLIGMVQTTHALDNIPEHDFNMTRFYLRMNLFLLVLVIAFLGFTIYNLPRMLGLVQMIAK